MKGRKEKVRDYLPILNWVNKGYVSLTARLNQTVYNQHQSKFAGSLKMHFLHWSALCIKGNNTQAYMHYNTSVSLSQLCKDSEIVRTFALWSYQFILLDAPVQSNVI